MANLNLGPKISIFFIIFLLAIVLGPARAEAAKKFVRKTKTVRRTSSFVLPTIVRYRSDHRGLLLSFTNFNSLESVTYSFTYTTNGIPQGVGGTIVAASNPTAQRELLFGTCSGGVCRYHYNLANARLSLTAKFTNGKTGVKGYRIKTYQ